MLQREQCPVDKKLKYVKGYPSVVTFRLDSTRRSITVYSYLISFYVSVRFQELAVAGTRAHREELATFAADGGLL